MVTAYFLFEMTWFSAFDISLSIFFDIVYNFSSVSKFVFLSISSRRDHPLSFDNDYGISTIGNELLFTFTILQILINCVKERLLWFDNGLLLST